MSKSILLLPGTKWQVELAKTIKKLGYTLYVVDPSKTCSCEQYADIFLNVDIYDQVSIDDFIKQHPIDGVISDECDIATPIVTRIGQKFNLQNIGYEMSILYTDKYAMREFCKKNKMLYPEYKMCRTIQELKAFYDDIGEKIIIKPLDSNASKGVFTIKEEKDIDKHFYECIKYSRIEEAVIAERYIEGEEFTVDGIVTPMGYYTLAISEKKHFCHNENIANELYFTHYNEKYDYDMLKKINEEFVLKSGLKYGLTHAEYKYENGKFYLIEIAARGGGNKISSLITHYMSGYDTYDYLIECVLGNVQKLQYNLKSKYQNRAMILKFFDIPCHQGKVSDIQGIEYLENNPNIFDYYFSFQIGDVISDCISDSARVGYYIAGADSKEELDRVINNINEKVKIIM